jgi:hypothetical protein
MVTTLTRCRQERERKSLPANPRRAAVRQKRNQPRCSRDPFMRKHFTPVAGPGRGMPNSDRSGSEADVTPLQA